MVDASDPWIHEKIRIVDETLAQIGAKQGRIMVFNKSDLLSDERQLALSRDFDDLHLVFISAEGNLGMDILLSEMRKFLNTQK